MTVPLTALAFLAGWFAWTLAEYLLHRFAMHALRGRGIASREHLRHHSTRDSILEYWALSWTGVFLVAIGLVAGLGLPVAFGVGYVFGYGFYDLHHYRAHRKPIANRYERWLRKHHFHHHFGHPLANHGVTLPLWDHVFGTYEEPGMVKVPRRMAMIWLVDDQGEVLAQYAGDYAIAGVRVLTEEQRAEDVRNAFANVAPTV